MKAYGRSKLALGILHAGWLRMGAVLVAMLLASGARMDGQTATALPQAVPGRLIKRVDPAYPGIAKFEQVDGVVTMKATVGVDGTVKNIRVTHGLPQLIPSAVHAVSQWVYEPFRVNGVATPAETTITIDFKLEKIDAVFGGMPNQTASVAATPAAPTTSVMPPPAPGVMRISSGVMATLLKKRVAPIYPADAIPLDARGTVVLLATVSAEGDVREVEVLSGPERFREAAVAAVGQWQYRAYLVDGRATEVQTTVTLNFAPPG